MCNFRILFVVLFLILSMDCICSKRRPSVIQQMYPSNSSYCCHCPSIMLHCNFSENPINAYWSVVDNGNPVDVTDTTTGHIVFTSEMDSGTLRLEVNDTKYSRNKMYICTASYGGESLEVETSQPFMVPMEENLTAVVYNVEVEQEMNELVVTWAHDFYLCREFTVSLNGTKVPNCKDVRGALNCTIGNVQLDVSYKVTVTATEEGTESRTASRIYSPSSPHITPSPSPPPPFCRTIDGICIWLIVSCIVILLVLVLVLVLVLLTVIKRVSHRVKCRKPANKAKVSTLNDTKRSTIPADA